MNNKIRLKIFWIIGYISVMEGHDRLKEVAKELEELLKQSEVEKR